MKAWQDLMRVVERLRFEPHDIAAQLDGRRHYAMELSEEFPLSIKLFRYTSRRHTRGATWHERLELFLPIDGTVRFRMGEQEVELQRGDLLVVDNLKLHHVVDFPGFNTRVVVISFLPEFVYSLGSPSHDYAFLLPFYSKTERQPHVLRIGDYVYGPNGDFGATIYMCVNIKTGEIVWRERKMVRANALLVGDQPILLDEDGSLHLVKLSPQGLEIQASAPLLENLAWTPPSIAGTRLFLRDRKSMMAVELK